MVSHATMKDPPDNDPRGDLDALASSDDSDQDEDKSYYVETIWAERGPEGETEYLVKWADYPADRATWEPVDMFDDEEETLKDWNARKEAVKSGKLQPFDLESWERHCAALKQFREDRRRRRENGMSGEASSEALVDPRKPIFQAESPPPPPQTTPAQAVESQKKPPASHKLGARQPLPKKGQVTKLAHANPTNVLDSSSKRRKVQASQQPNRTSDHNPFHQPTHKQPPHLPLQSPQRPTVPPVRIPRPRPSGFGVGRPATRGGHHRGRGERTPDITQLDLIRPSQFPERTGRAELEISNLPFYTSLSAPPPPGNTRRRSIPSPPPPLSGLSVPRTQTARDRREQLRSRRSHEKGDIKPTSSIYSRRESPTRVLPRPRSWESSHMPKGSNATAVAENARLSALTTPPVDLSMEAQLARMPTGIPNVQARTIPGGYWFNPGEALITTSFRPEKKFIGLTRVCGLMPSYVKDLLQNKPPNSQVLPIQFEDLCSTDEFLRLRTQSTATELSQPTVARCTGWIEGFQQTNGPLLRMAEHLRTNDLVAIFYPQTGGKFAWVASSRYSQNPKWTNWLSTGHNRDAPNGVPLLLTACQNLLPVISLDPQTHGLPLPVRDSGPKHGYPSLDRRLRAKTTFPDFPSAAPKDLVSTDSHPLATKPDNGALDAPTPVGGNLLITADEMTKLRKHFMTMNLSSDDLAIIEQHGKRSKAGTFYLHCPLDNPDAMAEFELMKMMYGEQGVVIFTNENPNHWASFVNDTKQGVAIFHESFNDYESLQPPIARLNKRSFNFWVVRVSRPLELADPDFTARGSHVQKLFPQGTGMILITEDAMKNFEQVAITLQWLYLSQGGQPKGRKMLLFPHILDWIERRVKDPRLVQQHKWLSIIKMLIIKNNQTSPIAVFTESSMDFRYLKDFKSAVVTLPTVAYGAHIAAYMSTQAKEERDANQLIETFAGLAKSTMDRFRYFSVITSESYKASGFRDNWTKWGHITIDYGFERFFERFKVDQAGILSEINASSRPT